MRRSSTTLSSVSLCLALLTLGLSGCDMLVSGKGDGSVSPAAAPAVGPAPKAPKAEVEPEATELEYVYNPIGKRDPFRSFLTLGGRMGTGDGPPLTKLQKYEIDQYQLVGIVWGVERPRALVEDPEGIGHVMEIGTYIGKNWGKVTQISPTEVVVTEEYQTIDGELVVNAVPMKLPVNSVGDM